MASPVEGAPASSEEWCSPAARASGIAALALAGILTHLAVRWGLDASPRATVLPLYVVLAGGGVSDPGFGRHVTQF
jgi:hypothetical protein